MALDEKIPQENRLAPYRLEGEKYEDYKLRRKLAKQAIKQYLRGTVVWNSSVQGTYIKNKEIGTE